MNEANANREATSSAERLVGGSSLHDDPRPAAVTFAITEHFTLQGARSSTIAESTGRANVFLGAVSGRLIALGLIGQASHLGTAFYASGLILLPTLTFVGLVTVHRVFQSGREDAIHAQRIAQLRAYYFDTAPEITRICLACPWNTVSRSKGSRRPPRKNS
jgi:hypothetical protein